MTAETTTETAETTVLRDVVTAALDRKAIQLRVLDLDRVSGFTEHFVICSGASDRQVQAIADAMIERLEEAGRKPLSVEGYRHASWVLLDCGSFVAHVFDEETRDFYALEKLWSDAPEVTEVFTG